MVLEVDFMSELIYDLPVLAKSRTLDEDHWYLYGMLLSFFWTPRLKRQISKGKPLKQYK